MNWYLSLVFVVGASVGSFLNVVIDRVPAGKDIIGKRSSCDKCKKTLAWYDLIPIISWLLLKGKCRYCREPISPQYPIVEGTSALLFVFVASRFFPYNAGNSALTLSHYLTLLHYLFSISVLIVIFVIDLKHQIIPNKISYFAIFIGLLVGWPLILVAIFLSFILGAVVGLNLILLRLRKFGQRIAFGPFMCVAAIITLFWGEKLFYWYTIILGF